MINFEYKRTLVWLSIGLLLVEVLALIKSNFWLPGLSIRVLYVLVPVGLLTLIVYFPRRWLPKKIRTQKITNKKKELVTNSRTIFHHKKTQEIIHYGYNTGLYLISILIVLYTLKLTHLAELKFNYELFGWVGVLWFLIVLMARMTGDDTFAQRLKKTSRWTFLALLFVVSVSSASFLKNVVFLEPVLEALNTIQMQLAVITLGYGATTFYLHREKLNKIDEETEQEKNKEEKRKKEFAKKHSRMNSIPVLKHLFKWMYKEGWWYAGGLILIVILSFSLRIINLDLLQPYTDEYLHLVGAKGINEIGSPREFVNGELTVPYTRAYFLTYGVSLSFRIFGETLYVARFGGAFFSALTVIVLYFIGRKINKYVGLISGFLWCISPWAIAVSKTVREYAYFPFFILLVILLLYKINGVLVRAIQSRKAKFTKRHFFYMLLYLMPLFYAFFLDFDSSFKQIILVYIGFIILLFLQLIQLRIIRKKALGVMYFFILLGVLLFALSFFRISVPLLSLAPHFNGYWLWLIFGSNSTIQWFYNSAILGFYVVIIISLCLLSYMALKDKTQKFISILLLILIHFYFFTFHFSRYTRPRYGLILLIFVILLFAIGIFYFFKIFNGLKKKGIHILALIFIFLAIISMSNTIMAIKINQTGYVPITDEHHDDFEYVITQYKDNMSVNDTIITSLYQPFIFNNIVELSHNKLYEYRSDDEQRFSKIEQIVESSDSGWIILDWRRNNRWSSGLAPNDQIIGSKQVRFISFTRGWYVYKW